ncbi:MAG: hypothetical protein AVDCRST_MAG73-340 [uncultured Thermomicrobiales bacterium]|uniref:DUF2442 domain-containing protein n=1 Tax=uncultured Thermomicrobiales bacterium TaxID=1645740 RepID=A0A6J4THZ2_9BACT|nr:MAG: hypothetical protein AVDCRST_MAG73-340 [uncultured Thermomicrobiales bacterium]
MERVVEVHVPRPFVLDLPFTDGTRGEVELESELWGEVFEPLRDPAYFALVTVDEEIGTVVWPSSADLAPEFLYYGDENPYATYLEQHGEPVAVGPPDTRTVPPDR